MMFSRMPLPSYLLLLLAVVVLFGLSGNMLYQAGIFYDSAGGNPLHKIHPSFYLLFAALACWALLYQGGWQRVLILAQLQSHFALLLAAACLFCYDLLLSRPLSSTLVTYISAAFFLLLLRSLSTRRLQILKNIVLLMLSANAVVGLYEYLSGGLIVPLVLTDVSSGEIIDTSEWGQVRSAGLMGHPLTSSMVCGFYLVCYFARLLFARPAVSEHLTAVVVLVALPQFGGRGALLAAVLVILLMVGIKLLRVLQQRKTNPDFVLYLLISLLVLPIAGYAAMTAGLLDPLLSRLEDDQGSAETRLIALQIMADTAWQNILFGDLDRSLSAKAVLYGTRYGIEIGWVALILSYGLLLTLLVIYALWLMVRGLSRQYSRLIVFPWLYSILAWTSGTGISGKTLMLSAAIVITFAVFSGPTSSEDNHAG